MGIGDSAANIARMYYMMAGRASCHRIASCSIIDIGYLIGYTIEAEAGDKRVDHMVVLVIVVVSETLNGPQTEHAMKL